MTYKNFLEQSKKLNSKERINAFLNHILKIIKSNPNISEYHNIVYHELTVYGINNEKDMDNNLQQKNIKNEGMYNYWLNKYRNYPNLEVFTTNVPNHFLGFSNEIYGVMNFEKIYLSLDHDHIMEGANQIFEFLAKNDIKHASKIASKMRTDNIVIRLKKEDIEGRRKLLNFIESNNYIQDGLNQLNPFMPGNGKISSITDFGTSYNSYVADRIVEFVEQNKYKDSVDIYGFQKYLQDNYNHHNDFNMLYEHINDVSYKEFIDYKEKDLQRAIEFTYEKYGYNQCFEAIKKCILENNFNLFSRGNDSRIRQNLIKDCNGSGIKKIVEIKVKEYYNSENLQDLDIDQSIHYYLNYIIQKIKRKNFEIVTEGMMKKYDMKQTAFALKKYIEEKNANSFSRNVGGDVNYREKITTILPSDCVIFMLEKLGKDPYGTTINNPYPYIIQYLNLYNMEMNKSK